MTISVKCTLSILIPIDGPIPVVITTATKGPATNRPSCDAPIGRALPPRRGAKLERIKVYQFPAPAGVPASAPAEAAGGGVAWLPASCPEARLSGYGVDPLCLDGRTGSYPAISS